MTKKPVVITEATAQRIKQLRETRNLSVPEIAQRIGVSQYTIYRLIGAGYSLELYRSKERLRQRVARDRRGTPDERRLHDPNRKPGPGWYWSKPYTRISYGHKIAMPGVWKHLPDIEPVKRRRTYVHSQDFLEKVAAKAKRPASLPTAEIEPDSVRIDFDAVQTFPRVLKNQVYCRNCRTVLTSTHRHDFKVCQCNNHTFTDGGHDYVRFGGTDLSLVEDRSVYRFTGDDLKAAVKKSIAETSFLSLMKLKYGNPDLEDAS